MNAVGIDVSKGKSMVAIMRPFGEIVSAPFEIKHTTSDINSLVELINSVDGESRIVMEHTGRYYEVLAHQLSEANLFVSAINPKLIKDFDNDSLRKVKSDKADAVKIARYALDKWQNLKQYSVMDELRNQLKTMNRQFGFYMKHKTAMKNNLIGILDQTYPGVNTYFDSPARSDGSQKWVDFAASYWHVDCVRKMSLYAFIDHYQNWCRRKKYNFSKSKAEEIYGKAKELVPVLPKDEITKLIIKQAIDQLNSASATRESCSSGKHKGQTKISHRGRKRLRYWLFQAAKSAVSHADEFKQLHEYYTTRPNNPLKKMQSLIVIQYHLCILLLLIFQSADNSLRKNHDYFSCCLLLESVIHSSCTHAVSKNSISAIKGQNLS